MSFDEYGSNSGFFEDMHRRYLENPQSVDASWRAFFEGEATPGEAQAPTPEPEQPITPAPEVPDARPPERPEGAEAARPANERQSAAVEVPAADERVSETRR